MSFLLLRRRGNGKGMGNYAGVHRPSCKVMPPHHCQDVQPVSQVTVKVSATTSTSEASECRLAAHRNTLALLNGSVARHGHFSSIDHNAINLDVLEVVCN